MSLVSLLEELDITEYKRIEAEAAISLAHRWLSFFCQHRTSFKGILGGKSYLWDEIHSDNQNDDAIREYQNHAAPSYVIMADNFGEFNKELIVTQTKPLGNPALQDFHVFPKNYAWSMAFTHEDGWIGPKFFKHSNYKLLNKQNEKSICEINRTKSMVSYFQNT